MRKEARCSRLVQHKARLSNPKMQRGIRRCLVASEAIALQGPRTHISDGHVRGVFRFTRAALQADMRASRR